MPKKKDERLSFESASYEDQMERVRELLNEHDNRIDALENAIPQVPEGPKTKEECEEKGGKWDDEKNVCILPEKKKEVVEGQIGILPTSTSTPVEDQRVKYFREKILGKEKEEKKVG